MNASAVTHSANSLQSTHQNWIVFPEHYCTIYCIDTILEIIKGRTFLIGNFMSYISKLQLYEPPVYEKNDQNTFTSFYKKY